MSDPEGRSSTFTERGESPSLLEGEKDAETAEVAVTGSIRTREQASAYEAGEVVGGIDVRQLALALAEQLKPAAPVLPMFGELVDAWLQHIRPKRVEPANEERLANRLKPLFLEDESTMTAAAVSECIANHADLGASTRNKLRSVGRLIVEYAQACERWNKPNPFALVKREKEPRRKYEVLTLEELYKIQLHLRADRLRLFRAAIHLGMRPGELMGLRTSDIDFQNHVIHVRVSRDRDETKTGEPRTIPLHPAVFTDLLDASVASKTDLVFGHHVDGSMQSQNTKLTRILRTAMAAAGVGVLGVHWHCRRRGCGFKETLPGNFDRRKRRYCPTCEMKLWPVPLIREVRWYDLRHMCATLHHEHGADPTCIKLALGHSLEGTTEEIYTHPSAWKMMEELTKWKLVKPPRQD